MRTLVSHMDDVIHLPAIKNVDVILMTECHLDHIPFRKNHWWNERFICMTKNRKGGAMCVSKNQLTELFTFYDCICDMVMCGVNVDCLGEIIIMVIYRHPNPNMKHFFTLLDRAFQTVKQVGKPFFVMGDFNEDVCANKQSYLSKFMECFNLKQYIDFPTHQSGSVIDHFWTNVPKEAFSLYHQETYYSDHYPFAVIFH